MEVSALRYSGAAGRSGRSPLLKLQSDERLVAMVRRGNQGAFEALVARYNARLLSFCRHMLGSREDAEDVLQDVLTASYNAMLADDRPINVRPWLYRIARNRCLNHLRRNRAVGVDSMDIHFAEHGASTADKVNDREEFRQLLHDIRDLPETQRTALVLREMDALSYEQIAEAMETTVSSVKSLLVRARVSLTEAAEARLLSCEEVREELAEVAEGMRRKQSASVRRHVKNCPRCEVFQGEMRKSSRALAALAPIGPFALFHKLLFAHAATHSAGSAGAGVAGAAGAGGAGGAGAAGAGAAGAGAAGAAGGASSAGLVTAGVGAVATKAAAGIAAAALVTAGTVAIDHGKHHKHVGPSASALVARSLSSGLQSAVGGSTDLGGSVGSGPGLTAGAVRAGAFPATAARAAAASKAAHGKLEPAALTAGKAVTKGSQATRHVATAGAPKPPGSNPRTAPAAAQQPAATSQNAVSTSTLSSSGGAGLGTTSSTSSGASATLTTTTAAGTTPPVTTTTTTTPVTATPPGTTTTPTGTTTGTSTSPTVTSTLPTATTTLPTGTTTLPTGTTGASGTVSTPDTDTNPSDTSTDSTTTPIEPS